MEKKENPIIKCNISYNKTNKQLNANLLKKPLKDILKNKIPKKLTIKDYEFEF